MDVNSVDAAVAALVLPPLISALNRSRWSPQLKGAVALLVCLIYAAAAAFLREGLDLSAWRDTSLTVAASALAAYKVWWQPSGIGPAIEAATTPTPKTDTVGAEVTDENPTG